MDRFWNHWEMFVGSVHNAASRRLQRHLSRFCRRMANHKYGRGTNLGARWLRASLELREGDDG